MTPGHGVNLIPAARRHTKQRRARTKLWFSIAVSYGGLVMLVVIFTRVLWVFDSRSLTSQLAGLMAEIENSDAAAKSLRLDLKNARALAETRNVVADQPDWSLLLAALPQIMGDEVVLRSVQLKQEEPKAEPAPATTQPPAATTPASPGTAGAEPTGAKSNASANQLVHVLAMAGFGKSQSSVSLFLLRLEQFGMFEQVRLVETRREPFLTSEAVAFRITCTLK